MAESSGTENKAEYTQPPENITDCLPGDSGRLEKEKPYRDSLGNVSLITGDGDESGENGPQKAEASENVKESTFFDSQGDAEKKANILEGPEHKTGRERASDLFNKIMGNESDASGDEVAVRRESIEIPHPSIRSPLRDRLPKAEKRMLQNLLYTTLVEDRLRYLEKSVKALQNRGDEDPKSEKPKKFNHVPAIRYLKWADFETKPVQREQEPNKLWIHGDPGSMAPQSVLEVLIEEPRMNIRRRYSSRNPEAVSMVEMRESGTGLKLPKPDQTEPRLPIRLRIRSPSLVKILAKFNPPKDLGSHDRATVTLLRPFKLLVKNVEQIKDYLKVLEEKHQEKAASSGNPTSEANNKIHSQIGSTGIETSQQPLDLESPEAPLETACEGPENKTESYEALEHLRILVNFIDDDLKHIWDLRQKYKEGTLRKIAFTDLWHLFDYGQEVRTPGSKGIQLYRVIAFTGGREIIDWTSEAGDSTPAKKVGDYSQGAFIVRCYHLDFNGAQYGPKDTFFMIRRYEGEKDIDSLPCFPLACDPHRDRVRMLLLDRGVKFVKLSALNNASHRHKTYVGLTIDKQQEQVDSQVIVDFQWAFLRNPDWKPDLGFTNAFAHDERETDIRDTDLGRCGREGCCGNDFLHYDYAIDQAAYNEFEAENKDFWDQVDSADDLNDDEKVLLPPRAFGFVLRNRKWATFAIELLGDVAYNDGWSNLELPPGHKDTVLALVQNHTGGPSSGQNRSQTFATMDLIRGKGKGLIILLHGEPGVGKTSTAECVADHTKRPLFPITCGDIGDNAEKVEENLESNFQLAHRWGCVLLLDEADIFLQKRDRADLSRNAIVSVFLRTLEYYSGILFLTTNRVGVIDEAFRSRIHLSLLYPSLNWDTTAKIWTNHISRIKKQLKEEKKTFEIDKKDIIRFAKSHYRELKRDGIGSWNGRQIRNAFQTAMALAEFDAQSQQSDTLKLSLVQFKKVAETSKQFDIYLKTVYGGRDSADVARMDQTRADGVTGEQFENLGATVARQMAPRMAAFPTATATSSRKGKMSAAKKLGVQQPQQQLREEENSEDLSDDEDLDSEDEEDEESLSERE